MADVNYIVPGSGIVQDQENGYEMIIPGFGIYDEQEAAGQTYQGAASDGMSLSEAAARIMTAPKTALDDLTLSEAVARVMTAPKSDPDIACFTD